MVHTSFFFSLQLLCLFFFLPFETHTCEYQPMIQQTCFSEIFLPLLCLNSVALVNRIKLQEYMIHDVKWLELFSNI